MATVLAFGAVLLLPLAGCGESSSGAAGQSGGPVEIRVGAQPFADSVGVYIAQQEGYFEEEGLKVSITKLQAGDQIVTAVLGGSLEIGMSGTVPQLTAMAQGVPIQFISGVTIAKGAGKPNGHALLVREDSPIRSAQDLAGKRIAANVIGSVVWLTSNAWLAENGVDPNAVEYAEVPFPQMGDALRQGQVDAILALEPFTTRLQVEGSARRVAYPYREVFPEGFPVETAVAETGWVEENPDVVRRFTRALARALELQTTDNARFREYVAEFTGLDPAVTAEINLTEATAEVDVDGLQQTVGLLARFGVLEEEFDVSQKVFADAEMR